MINIPMVLTFFPRILLLLLALTPVSAWSQCDECLVSGQFNVPEIRFQLGDDPQYADPFYDDSGWPVFNETRLGDIKGIYWMRGQLHIYTANLTPATALEIELHMLAAYEFYIEGELIFTSGIVGASRATERPGPINNRFPLPRELSKREVVTFAIRASSEHRRLVEKAYFDPFGSVAFNGVIQWMKVRAAVSHLRPLRIDDWLFFMLMGIPLIIGCYFLFIYLGQRENKHFLVFSLLNLSMFMMALLESVKHVANLSYDWYFWQWWCLFFFVSTTFLALPAFFLYRFNLPRKAVWLLALYLIGVLTAVNSDSPNLIGRVVLIESCVASLLMHLVAWRRGVPGLFPTALGVGLCLVALLFGAGWFMLGFVILLALILWQLAGEVNLQREKHFRALVNASKLEAELLRKNMQPHFLMNSLTSLIEWVEVDPEKGAEFVEALGSEFQILTNVSGKGLISLGQEIELCRLHMRIMGFRLQKTFRLSLEGVDPDCQVPPAIFHTLVENGISHNHYINNDITFTLTARRDLHGQHFRFETPFAEKVKPARASTGSGIKYIEAQLERMYPGHWKFHSAQFGEYWRTSIDIVERPSKP